MKNVTFRKNTGLEVKKKSAVLAAVRHILEMTRHCGNKVCLVITFYR